MRRSNNRSIAWSFAAVTGVIYFISNPKPNFFYDYTFRIAGEMLNGRLGLEGPPPVWLNEFVPADGLFYSVFPLGSVLTMMPAAMLRSLGIIQNVPAGLIAALIAGFSALLLFRLGESYGLPVKRILMMASGILFGTWMWMNLTYAGAWHLALGFSVLGELGALYFVLVDRKPFLAGIFFALAFGNRTEVLLTAPIFLILLIRGASDAPENSRPDSKETIGLIAKFCSVPFVLGVATLVYNQARFGSALDFGYSHIPGVLNEPWYQHGIFSIYYIPRQAWEMLLKLWHLREAFPYLVPDGFSSSILLSSPFMLLALRFGSKDRLLKYLSWTAIALMTFLLWLHGNSGGWQFGYRYAMVLLPWVFIILCGSCRSKIGKVEAALYGFSFIANAYAVWIFHWTKYAAQ